MASYGYYNGGNMHGMHGSGNGFFNHFQRPLNWSALGKFDNISPPVQKHLQRVYATLSGGILAATLGAFLDYKFHVAGMMTQLSLFGAIIGLSFISDVYNRLAVFHAAGLLMGINLGPLLGQVAFYRPDIIITALTGTTMIFISFSAAALLAQRRHFLYLGGVLGSAISILFSLRMLNFFMGGTLSAGLFAVELYGGLFMFMCYIIFDTQMIIEDAHSGRRDFVSHALELLMDFVGVFVRLLIILQRNAQKKSENERRRRQ
jgi:FtsH-binding integral membrane protein